MPNDKLCVDANLNLRCEPVAPHQFSRQRTTDEIITDVLAGNVTFGFQQVVNGFDGDLSHAKESVSKLTEAIAQANSYPEHDPIKKNALEQSLVSAESRLEALEQLEDLINHGRGSERDSADLFRAVLEATTNVSDVPINKTAELTAINVELHLLKGKLDRMRNAIANGLEVEGSALDGMQAIRGNITELVARRNSLLDAAMPDSSLGSNQIGRTAGVLDLRRYIVGGNEPLVVQQTQCPPGSYVSTPSDGTTNQKCSLCPPNTYTSRANELSCLQWSGTPA